MTDIAKLKADLERDEGRRKKVYLDSEGIETIGVGRNIRNVGLSDAEIDLLLDNDIAKVESELDHAIPWWRGLSEPRQRALANMCFMGIGKLLGFKRMLAALEFGDYERAASEALNSKWAGQVGSRAYRIAQLIKGGS